MSSCNILEFEEKFLYNDLKIKQININLNFLPLTSQTGKFIFGIFSILLPNKFEKRVTDVPEKLLSTGPKINTG